VSELAIIAWPPIAALSRIELFLAFWCVHILLDSQITKKLVCRTFSL